MRNFYVLTAIPALLAANLIIFAENSATKTTERQSVCTVDEEDGFVNVRSSPSLKSRIEAKLITATDVYFVGRAEDAQRQVWFVN